MATNSDSIHILLIEDNPGDIRLIEEMLRETKGRKFVLSHSTTLIDGLQLLIKDSFDVLLLDLSLPDSLGFDTFIKAYNRYPGIPIIILTGTQDEALAVKTVQVGAQDYLIKGQINGTLLSRSISYAIERASLSKKVQEELNERKAVEMRLRKTNRALRMLSKCNEIVVRALDEQTLTENICNAIIAVGEYHFVQISLVDQKNCTSIRSIAAAGLERGQYPESASVFHATDNGNPWQKALTKQMEIICNDVMVDKDFSLLRTEANKVGYRSFAVLPLTTGGITLGLIQIYSKVPNTFDLEEMNLLHELEEDLNYAIVSIRTEEERKRAEEALRKSEIKYRDLVEQINDVIFTTDIHGNFIYISPTIESLSGYKPEEMIGHPLAEFLDPEYVPNVKEQFQKVISGKLEPFEYRVKIKSGKFRWVRSSSRPIFEGNKPVGLRGVITDITARKQAEEALDLFNHSIKSINECVSITDLNNIILFVNQAFFKTYGYTEEEVIGKPIYIVRTDTPIGKDNVLDNTLHGGWQGELLNRKKDGTIFPISLRTSVVYNEKGQPIALVGIATDITERKRAEEMMKVSEEKYRMIFDEAPMGIAISTIEGKIIDLNKAQAEMIGGTVDELKGKSVDEYYIYPDKRREMIELFKKTGKVRDFEMGIKKKDGSIIVELLNLDQVKIGGKEYLFATGRDITERKVAEEALRLESAALNAAANAIVITGPDGIIQWVNRAFTTLTGYRVEEAFGKNPRELVKSGHHDKSFYKKLWDTILDGKVWRGEIINRRKDGSLYTEEQTITSLRDASGKISHFIGIKQDITQRTKMEEQLRQAQKLESLGTLASGIAHDFNNILAIIMGHSSLLQIIHDDPARLKESIETITKATERGASLVRQMLTFARKSEVEFKPVLVNDSIMEIEKLFHETFPKTMTLVCYKSDNLPLINADSTQLYQVLLNLCVNARDAMDGNGILTISTGLVSGESLNTRFVNSRFAQYVSIEVNDTGTGMDEATRQRIFEPFFTTKELGKGTGLGLSVVFGIMESHEGFIDVQSDIGRGTTFSLYFPVKRLIPENLDLEKEVQKAVPGGTETILVVEDEELLRELLRINLSGKGYNVLTVTNGEEAVEAYELNQHKIGLVLSDLGLPKLTGHEVLKQLMVINPAVKFILASGYNDLIEKSEILNDGAKEIVQKPYNTNDLLRKIRHVLDS